MFPWGGDAFVEAFFLVVGDCVGEWEVCLCCCQLLEVGEGEEEEKGGRIHCSCCVAVLWRLK